LVSFEWRQLWEFSSAITTCNYAELHPIVLDNDDILVWDASGSIWRTTSADYTSYTEVLSGLAGMDSNLVVFLDMGSGNVWVMYDFAGLATKLQESDDYGATWNGEVSIAALYGLDLFKIGTDAFCFGYDAANGTYEVWKWNSGGGTWDLQDTLAATGSVLMVSMGLVETNYYCIAYDEVGGDTGGYLYKYVNGTTTISNEGIIEDGFYVEQCHQDALFKATSAIWYVKLRNAGGDYRIYKTIDSGSNWSNVFEGENFYFYPSNYQRGGDEFFFFELIGGSKLEIDFFKYNVAGDVFFKIQRCSSPSGYSFSSLVPLPIAFFTETTASTDMKISELTNKLGEMAAAQSTYKTHTLPIAKFEYTEQLSPNQLIEIYENDSGAYTLCFRGKLGRPEYDSKIKTYQYSCPNLGWDDLEEEISYDAVAEGIDEVVIALVGELINPYIWCDATSVPNIAINMTYEFDKVKLRDALYVCAILANGYWWVEPNGYLYFRVYGDSPASGDDYTLAAKNMAVPTFNILQVQHNDFSNVKGGWDNANTTEFTPTTPLIAEHIQQYGKLLWRGRKSFVGATSQATLDAVVAGLKAWEGMVSNPLEISFYVKEYYYPVGYECSLTFSQISDLNFDPAEDFMITENIIDFLRTGADYIKISNNITRRTSYDY